MELPNFFTDKNTLLTYNYNNLKQILNTDIDNSYRIDNLSIDNKDQTFSNFVKGKSKFYYSDLYTEK